MLKKNIKQKILLLSLAIVMLFGAGVTIAYISTYTTDIKNTFNPSTVSCEVNESFLNNVKENVTVENTGDTDAYIRAEIVVTWQDEAGNVLAIRPVEGTDYKLVIGSDGWVKEGNIYYYKEPVPAEGDDKTTALITRCEALNACVQERYSLNVEILASAIQADGGSKVDDEWKPAVVQAWGVDPTTLE